MSTREEVRLRQAEEARYASTVAEIEDGIRALQSTDTPGTEELSAALFRRLEAFKKREAKQAKEWFRLIVRRETGGLRHYLNDEPVHAGSGLVLQSVKYDADDYGQFSVRLDAGTEVRYEASQDGSKVDWTVYADIGGHEFVANGETWMRFRWPKKAWQR